MKTLTQNDARELSRFRWYLAHKDHVTRLIGETDAAIEPSGIDALNPGLWKACHWRWWLSLVAPPPASVKAQIGDLA